MNKIEVKILDHNLNGMPKFLARLTQRGHLINSMADVEDLYDASVQTPPSKYLLTLPHTTIKRMNYLTIAITGLSTKAVSQIRTHAKRLTFVSTSTQYSSYEDRTDNYTMPSELDYFAESKIDEAYERIQEMYAELIDSGIDKDKASYVLPQGLRKALIISGNLDDWQYVLSLRLCHRNTLEVQHIMRLIYDEISNECGPEYVVGMLPPCVDGQCKEGKFSCGKRFIL
jgi:thymidylate synthase (FAD)